MNNELSIDKEKTVTLRFPGTINHFNFIRLAQLWQIINEFAFIFTLGHAEWELELKI